MKPDANTAETASASQNRATHTPGPWTQDADTSSVSGFAIRDKSGRSICTYASSGKRAKLEQEANARLIAAAPELLEACKEIIDGMIAGPNSTQKNVTSYAIHMVSAAISKTEGSK